MRSLLVVVVLIAAACGPDPAQQCRDFSRALCERLLECLPDSTSSLSECIDASEGDGSCANVFFVEGDVERCTTETRELSCDRLASADALDLPSSCDDVRYED